MRDYVILFYYVCDVERSQASDLYKLRRLI